MKKSIYSLLIIAMVAIAFSCKDESLDPLQFDKVKKGTILALRGTQLNNVYVKGVPGAEFFPRIATSADKFVFDAEYLSSDPTSLASVDVYVVKGSGANTSRVLVTNVPFSQFKTTSDYRGPWVTISLNLSDILSKLSLGSTFPLDAVTVNTLLNTYKFGINIQCDLNLTDGTKILASDIVAAGLFQSNQFYPAMRLVYTVTDYCSYVASDWGGGFTANEVYSNSVYGPYNITWVQDGLNPNKFSTNNFWDSGYSAYVLFSPSTKPSDQKVTFPEQAVGGGGTIEKGSTGTYDQCTGVFKVTLTYKEGTASYPFRYEFKKK